jgi:hypothetical protein
MWPCSWRSSRSSESSSPSVRLYLHQPHVCR